MTRLFVPACGDRIQLTTDWTFKLYLEHRNIAFAKAKGLIQENFDRWSDGWDRDNGYSSKELTLPAGTVLECDRVYIRNFNKSAATVESDFDSITWKVIVDGKQAKNQRFWAKLVDCNNIEFARPGDSNYKDRTKAKAEEEAKKAKKLDADEIRTQLYIATNDGTTPLGKMLLQAREDAMSRFFAESKELYDKTQKQVEDNHPSMRPFFLATRHHKDEFQERHFISLLFKNNSEKCKFSKTTDGRCQRKFSWGYPERIYYGADADRMAVAGLSYIVYTNVDDTEIVGIEFCRERAEK